MKDFKHGFNGYTRHRCRCGICKSAKAKDNAKYGSTPAGKASDAKRHAKYRATPRGKLTEAKRKATPEGRMKQKAHSAVSIAIRYGHLFSQSCLICDQGPTQGHHWHGYSPKHAGDVIWLCKVHHID